MRVRTQGRKVTVPAAVLVLIALALLAASAAQARIAYFTDADGKAVIRVDTATSKPIGAAIPVGDGPYSIALTPDGAAAFVTTFNPPGTLARIDTAAGQVVGTPVVLGGGPRAVAISPDGNTAWVALGNAGTVVRVDTHSNQVIGLPIVVGSGPDAIAITPDGARAFVVDNGSKSVSVIDTRSATVIGTITVGEFPRGIAITPDGSKAYVANQLSQSVSVIDARTGALMGTPITVGSGPNSVAISPDGRSAYVTNKISGNVSVIDTGSNSVSGAPIAVAPAEETIALFPDGSRAYVTTEGNSVVSLLDTASRSVLASPDIGGVSPDAIAFAPNQGPHASFTVARGRPGVPLRFDASGSSDPDGTVTGWAWEFGDGGSAGSGPATTHAYAKPGTYQASLTVTDNEGCSTRLIFTGQTAYCNGSAGASQAQAVTIAYPGVSVHCPKRAGHGGCRFRLQVVSAKPRAHAKPPKAESAIAKLKLKAGEKGIVSLHPKRTYRAKLAAAKKLLVRVIATVDGRTTTAYRKLRVVQ